MILQSKLYVFNSPSRKLGVREYIKEPLPILWNCRGEFHIIPEAVVENAIDNLAMSNKIEGKTTYPVVIIHWDQGIAISNEAGRALTGN